MRNLLKADLLRVVKDRLFIALIILCFVLSLMSPILTGFITLIVSSKDNTRELVSAASNALMAFTPLNNFGLILTIFMCVILCKDFNNGTIRNKIIAGKSRLAVFASNTITTIIFTTSFMLFGFLLSLGGNLIFFDLGLTTEKMVQDFWLSIGLSLLGWILISIVVSFFSTIIKNSGLVSVTILGIGFVLVIVSTVISTSISIEKASDNPSEGLIKTLEFFQTINVPAVMTNRIGISAESGDIVAEILVTLTGARGGYDAVFYLEYCGSCVLVSTALFVGGYFIFRRKNLK